MVKFEELACSNGHVIGLATLSAPKSLNALNLDMVEQLLEQLLQWQRQEKLAAVVLAGEGDKAFCAGGDVVSLHQAAANASGQVSDWASEFFAKEYRLDYLIHSYRKPIIVWGSGFVMGGGLGLMAGASHRIVTPSSRIAMPEVTIGLYPDVGASYFLANMPGQMGKFLGLTGYAVAAEDALYLGLADHQLADEQLQPLLEALTQSPWENSEQLNHKLTRACITRLAASSAIAPRASVLADNQSLVDELMAGNISDILERFNALETEQKWLSKAKRTLLSGSPLSIALIDWQASRSSQRSLATCFREELAMSLHCLAYGDFIEGVRALLIDKDKNPRFKYATYQDIPEAAVQQLVQSPWEAHLHPLADLENTGEAYE
ncbi:enoyl-CoA hydratase/isomerase family protein [Paraferrimonas haliotis]|uniref:enoyl-CoA hydratase/isomerase family protein n=1 Tax=Paraferrimonas haliotis TaxID=2013866 RepID=UPI000BA94847|nr:enoyl-CoA hydratase/isomerase family protein [Paraferrimonas haliotis]